MTVQDIIRLVQENGELPSMEELERNEIRKEDICKALTLDGFVEGKRLERESEKEDKQTDMVALASKAFEIQQPKSQTLQEGEARDRDQRVTELQTEYDGINSKIRTVKLEITRLTNRVSIPYELSTLNFLCEIEYCLSDTEYKYVTQQLEVGAGITPGLMNALVTLLMYRDRLKGNDEVLCNKKHLHKIMRQGDIPSTYNILQSVIKKVVVDLGKSKEALTREIVELLLDILHRYSSKLWPEGSSNIVLSALSRRIAVNETIPSYLKGIDKNDREDLGHLKYVMLHVHTLAYTSPALNSAPEEFVAQVTQFLEFYRGGVAQTEDKKGGLTENAIQAQYVAHYLGALQDAIQVSLEKMLKCGDEGASIHKFWSKYQLPEQLMKFRGVDPQAAEALQAHYYCTCAELDAIKAKKEPDYSKIPTTAGAVAYVLGSNTLSEDVKRGYLTKLWRSLQHPLSGWKIRSIYLKEYPYLTESSTFANIPHSETEAYYRWVDILREQSGKFKTPEHGSKNNVWMDVGRLAARGICCVSLHQAGVNSISCPEEDIFYQSMKYIMWLLRPEEVPKTEDEQREKSKYIETIKSRLRIRNEAEYMAFLNRVWDAISIVYSLRTGRYTPHSKLTFQEELAWSESWSGEDQRNAWKVLYASYMRKQLGEQPAGEAEPETATPFADFAKMKLSLPSIGVGYGVVKDVAGKTDIQTISDELYDL